MIGITIFSGLPKIIWSRAVAGLKFDHACTFLNEPARVVGMLADDRGFPA